jgi:hypothetical protein
MKQWVEKLGKTLVEPKLVRNYFGIISKIGGLGN